MVKTENLNIRIEPEIKKAKEISNNSNAKTYKTVEELIKDLND